MVTKEQVLAKAAELSMTLTEQEVDQFVKDGKLPEKKAEGDEPGADAIVKKYEHRELAEMYRDACAEAKKYRLQRNEYKEALEKANEKLAQFSDAAGKVPELEGLVRSANDMVKELKDAEKSRRVAALEKLPEEQRKSVEFMTNPDTVKAGDFDKALALLVPVKNNGAAAPPPGASGPMNPWKKETRNIAMQVEIMKKDPALAERLQREAVAA